LTLANAVDKYYQSIDKYVVANGDEIVKINTDLDSYINYYINYNSLLN